MLVARYDRNAALLDGLVPVDGLELDITEENDDPARERLGLSGGFDAWEAYAGRYLMDMDAGRREFSAVPVYPKRTFRHGAIHVPRGGAVRGPEDLAGRRVGLQHWSTTAAVWAKGILTEDHHVNLGAIRWLQTSPDSMPWSRPDWLRLEQAPAGTDLAALLLRGEIDAAITSQAWAPYEHPELDFLFPDYPALERAWYARTRIFPIMHVLLVRSSILDRAPWVARRLCDAWAAAKMACLDRMERDRLVVTSMWFQGLLQEERAAMGSRDTYPYGLAPARHELSRLIEYAVAQGLIRRLMAPDELFHPAARDC